MGEKRAILVQFAEPAAIACSNARIQHTRGGDAQLVRDSAGLPRALVIPEEEQLVLDNRTAKRSAEILPSVGWDESACERVLCRLGKRIARIGGVGPTEIKASTVEVIASRLGLNRYDACHGLAELSVIILQRKLGFGDGIDVGINNDDSQDWILVIGTIQLVGGTAKVLPVHKNLLAALRILRRRMGPADKFLSAWRS